MGVVGNLDKLAARVLKLKAVAEKSIRDAAPKIQGLIEAEFSAGSGPYGAPWQAKKDGGAPFSGTSADGWVKVKVIGKTTIKATIVKPGVFHNAGTKSFGRKSAKALRAALKLEGYARKGIKGIVAERKSGAVVRLPQRQILPDEGTGIPPTWQKAMRAAVTKNMLEAGARKAGG